jgi:hypothetical protein
MTEPNGNRPCGCTCDFKTFMVGDGCEACNPKKGLEYAKETIADLKQQAILRDLEIVRLREALGELLTLEYAKEQLGYLRKGIGTATKDRVWLDAESALSTPIDLSALARHDEEIVGPWKMDAERLRQFTIWADAGLAPCLVYDDDGHWSVSFEGISEDSFEGWQTSWVQSRVDEWHDSPEDAIDSAIDATKGEKD